jgi:hypothetical protein
MEVFVEIVKIVLIITGAATWVLGMFLMVFYWMCQIPPKD